MNNNILLCATFVLLILFVFFSCDAAIQKGCTRPLLQNGRVDPRQRGHVIKFICNIGFKLLGNRYAVCSASTSTWDVPIPVCIKTGCGRLRKLEHGMAHTSNRGALVLFFCDPEYQLVGTKTAYCDGRNWNATMPTCISTAIAPPLSCDFEKADMCGWRQDELHDFDWSRISRATPSNMLETGPKYDHTQGEGKYGYYMYIESSYKIYNDKARLLSPLYKSDLTKDGCFSFYYHMYGKGTGTLKVYVKPETVDLHAMLNNEPDLLQRYTFFTKTGNQGDIWYRAVFNLNELEENFQIVIEGTRGVSYTSDIAIDDVAILQGADCVNDTEMENSKEILPTLTDSCQNRCGIYVNETSAGEEVKCTCTEDCWVYNNCCFDYLDLCLFGTSGIPDASLEEKSTLAPFLPEGMKRVASNTTEDSEVVPLILGVSTTTTLKPETTPKTTVSTLKTSISTLKTTISTFKTTVSTLKPTVSTLKPTVSIQKITTSKQKTTTSATTTPSTTISTTVKKNPTTTQTERTTAFKITTPKTPKTTVKIIQTVEKRNSTNVIPTRIEWPIFKNESTTTKSVTNATTTGKKILTTTPSTIFKYSRTIGNHNEDFWANVTKQGLYGAQPPYKGRTTTGRANLGLEISMCIFFMIIIVVGITIMARHRNFRNYITRRRSTFISRGTNEVRFLTNEEEVDFE